MTDKRQFIDTQILPILGDFAGDFDVDAIFDEVAEYDGIEGFVWRTEYDVDELNEVLQRHNLS